MKRFLLIAALCVAAASCTQEATLSLSADIPTAEFGPEGGSFNPILFTNGPSWTATCEDDAVTVTPASGSYTTPLHIEVGENNEQYTKVIRIVVKTELDALSRQAFLVVTQGCRPFVTCEDSSRIIGPELTQMFFFVNSNNGWRHYRTLLDGEEVNLNGIGPYGGWVDPWHCEEPNRVQVHVQIPENDSGLVRRWELLLSSEAAPGVEACRLTIIQNAY